MMHADVAYCSKLTTTCFSKRILKEGRELSRRDRVSPRPPHHDSKSSYLGTQSHISSEDGATCLFANARSLHVKWRQAFADFKVIHRPPAGSIRLWCWSEGFASEIIDLLSPLLY